MPRYYLQVAVGDVDMALGTDSGGSVRLPSCWCGTVGMKPTFGLVPFTGMMPMDRCLDHAGPIAKTVYDCALLLEVDCCDALLLFCRQTVIAHCFHTLNNTASLT